MVFATGLCCFDSGVVGSLAAGGKAGFGGQWHPLLAMLELLAPDWVSRGRPWSQLASSKLGAVQ